MPPAKAIKSAPRKRTRKRKRRAVSSSSSSSSSPSDSSSSDDEQQTSVRPIAEPARHLSDSDSDSESESSDSSSGSSSVATKQEEGAVKQAQTLPQSTKLQRSPSPSPPPPELPSFLPEKQDPSGEQKEREMKEKFRKFWMSSVADGFSDDLEQLRKEPNLGTARLTLLIDSLASGAEVFSSKADDGVAEMDVVLG